MYVHWETDHIDLFCFNQQGFLLSNSFRIRHINDGIYYLLNAWKQLGFHAGEDELPGTMRISDKMLSRLFGNICLISP